MRKKSTSGSEGSENLTFAVPANALLGSMTSASARTQSSLRNRRTKTRAEVTHDDMALSCPSWRGKGCDSRHECRKPQCIRCRFGNLRGERLPNERLLRETP